MNKWNYGDAYVRHPIKENELAIFDNGGILKVHNLFDPLPKFMEKADLIFTDSPWNLGNLNSFYTKADRDDYQNSFELFQKRLFECIGDIRPRQAYLEIGKEYLADYIQLAKKQFKHVTFYNSSYYHKKDNMCYIVRGSNKAKKPKLDYVDEEKIIEWITANEEYECIGDLCMGRGLVAVNAYKAGKMFVGTELNHKRLSVAIERIVDLGGTYKMRKEV